MKKRITKIWGVGLIVTLLASLLVMASPASAADPLQWYSEVIPTETGKVLQPGLDIFDISVNPDGETIYAVGSNTTAPLTKKIYKSTNGGLTWTDISDATGLPANMESEFVACAPDDPDIVLVAQDVSGNCTVYISDDGGIEFGNVLFPTTGVTAITDIDVSAAVGGVNYAAISGVDGTGGNVWYYKLGIGGAWTPTSDKDGFATTSRATGVHGLVDTVLAIAFSPNFASDQVLTAVSANNSSATKSTHFQMLSVSTTAAESAWNQGAGFENYPVFIEDSDGDDITDAIGASIALSPTYLGGDEVERIVFVGLTTTTATETQAGVYRLMDYVDKAIWDETQVHSIAYDGTTVVAGQDNSIIWRCSDPLITIPTFYPTTTTKAPSSANAADPVIAWRGTSVVAATSGTMSAFSVSDDDGKSFNDVSLIDTSITAIEDVAVAAAIGKVYMVTDDTSDLSVWRRSSEWQRVLSVASTTNYIVRIAPDNPDVIYVAEVGGRAVYYSREGGDSKWYARRSAHDVQDLAVESEDVAYIAKENSDAVIKTTNAGFTWGAAEDTELASGYIHSIKSLGEDKLVVGGDDGYISYSTDGNDSWSKVEQQVPVGGNLVVDATGLADDDYIFVASATPGSSVYRWKVGQAQSIPWKDMLAMFAPGYNPSYAANGIVLHSGAMYVSTANATGGAVLRTLGPMFPDSMVTPPLMGWASTAPGGAISNLNVSATAEFAASDTTLTIWTVAGGNLKFFMDVLALAAAAPALIGPETGTMVKINPISGLVNDVVLTWSQIPFSTAYDVFVCVDPACLEAVYVQFAVAVAGLPVNTLAVPGTTFMPGTTYYWHLRTSTTGPLTGPFSETRSFTIESAAAIAPTIGSPANGAKDVDVNPAFSWSPVSGATLYEFQLAVAPSMVSPLYATELAETGIRPPVKLDPGTTYFWRVRAIEPIVGDWSTIANFMVAVPVVEKPPIEVKEIQPPEIVITTPPPQEVTLTPPPAPAPITPAYIWAIVIIGAILVIAVIVLIVRTRRTV